MIPPSVSAAEGYAKTYLSFSSVDVSLRAKIAVAFGYDTDLIKDIIPYGLQKVVQVSLLFPDLRNRAEKEQGNLNASEVTRAERNFMKLSSFPVVEQSGELTQLTRFLTLLTSNMETSEENAQNTTKT